MAELWFPVPPLAGDAVLLRPWGEADMPGIVLAFRDPVMRQFSWRTAPYTETDARDFFAEQEQARLRGKGLSLALAAPRDLDVVLGGISLSEVRVDRGRAAVGYWLAPGARGLGVATQAVRLLGRWAFAELGLARLELTCGPDNESSQHVAERCGFSREGLLGLGAPRSGLAGPCAGMHWRARGGWWYQDHRAQPAERRARSGSRGYAGCGCRCRMVPSVRMSPSGHRHWTLPPSNCSWYSDA